MIEILFKDFFFIEITTVVIFLKKNKKEKGPKKAQT